MFRIQNVAETWVGATFAENGQSLRLTSNNSVFHQTLEFLAPKRAPEFALEFQELGKWLGPEREYKLT